MGLSLVTRVEWIDKRKAKLRCRSLANLSTHEYPHIVARSYQGLRLLSAKAPLAEP
jgi:hypothetical protein